MSGTRPHTKHTQKRIRQGDRKARPYRSCTSRAATGQSNIFFWNPHPHSFHTAVLCPFPPSFGLISLSSPSHTPFCRSLRYPPFPHLLPVSLTILPGLLLFRPGLRSRPLGKQSLTAERENPFRLFALRPFGFEEFVRFVLHLQPYGYEPIASDPRRAADDGEELIKRRSAAIRTCRVDSQTARRKRNRERNRGHKNRAKQGPFRDSGPALPYDFTLPILSSSSHRFLLWGYLPKEIEKHITPSLFSRFLAA